MMDYPSAWLCRANILSEATDYTEALASPLIVFIGFTVLQPCLK